MIPRPQMTPKMDRKWSSTASDPQSRPQMIPWKIEGMDWILRDWLQKGLIIKRNLFLLPSREKGMEDGRSQVNLYKAKKKMEWNLKMILFQEFFIGVKKKSLILY